MARSKAPTVALVDQAKLTELIHGLSFVKTLVQKSQLGYEYQGSIKVPFMEQSPSAVTFGDNYEHRAFMRWVREEEVAQLARFKAECLHGTHQAWAWLNTANRARSEYFRNYQSTLESIVKINQELADAYRLSLRLAASTQYGCEVALAMMGLLGGAAYMTVNLALKKFVVGVAAGVLINVAESQSEVATADILMVPVTNVPGTVDDVMSNFLNAITSMHLMKFQATLARIEAEASRMTVNTGQDAVKMAEMFLKHSQTEQAIAKSIPAATTGWGKSLAGGFKAANWCLTGWSIWQASDKWYGRMTK
jgi:hypothetical protein